MAQESSKPDESKPDDAVRTASVEVFYDGGCLLCRAEMSYYQDQGADAQFTDITRSGASPSSTLSTRELKLIEIRGLLSSVPFLFPLPRLALLTTRQSV